jgi:hypothetical protein
MEWVHCHIARQPVSPAERLPGIPEAIDAIVMKLLAKTAEERYQTAAGVEADLRRCLVEWESHRHINPFPLGMHDMPNQLLIPERLYGRESAIDTLLAAFDHVVTDGVTELVLVSGYAGIGKSSVVNELHQARCGANRRPEHAVLAANVRWLDQGLPRWRIRPRGSRQHGARPKNGSARVENMCGGQRLSRPPERDQERPPVIPTQLRGWHLTSHERFRLADPQPLFAFNSVQHVFPVVLTSEPNRALGAHLKTPR